MFLQQQCLLQTIWGTTDEVSGLQHQQQLAVCRLNGSHSSGSYIFAFISLTMMTAMKLASSKLCPEVKEENRRKISQSTFTWKMAVKL